MCLLLPCVDVFPQTWQQLLQRRAVSPRAARARCPKRRPSRAASLLVPRLVRFGRALTSNATDLWVGFSVALFRVPSGSACCLSIPHRRSSRRPVPCCAPVLCVVRRTLCGHPRVYGFLNQSDVFGGSCGSSLGHHPMPFLITSCGG